MPDITSLEMTSEFLKFKAAVSEQIHKWTDKHSGDFPDLFLWRKIQGLYLQGAAAQTGAVAPSDKFSDKYATLRTYRTIFDRNKEELETLREEFLRLKFECVRRLYCHVYDYRERPRRSWRSTPLREGMEAQRRRKRRGCPYPL